MTDKAIGPESTGSFGGFAILELSEHRVRAGRVSVEQIAGAAFIRLDVPAIEFATALEDRPRVLPAFTAYFGATAIFSITPCDEATAATVARRHAVVPFAIFSAPRTAGRPAAEDYDDDVRDELDGAESDD